MIKFTVILFFSVIALSFFSCEQTASKEVVLPFDLSEEMVRESQDTVRIGDQLCVVRVYSDIYDENHRVLDSAERVDYGPKTLVVTDMNGEIHFEKKYYNEVPRLFKINKSLHAPGRLFVSFLSSGGGSGYTESLFWLDFFDGKLVLESIATTTELSYVYYNSAESKCLIVDFIWDMGDPETADFESHFSAHRCAVRLVEIGDLVATEKQLFTSVKKYEMAENETDVSALLQRLYADERNQFGDLRISEFVKQ